MDFETFRLHQEEAVLFTDITAPPMNLLGTELVRDLVSLIQRAEADEAVQVLVFRSADPDYFISHVDVTRINRALPASTLGEFVGSLAHRIAGFPAAGQVALKERVNAIALAPAEDFRRDSDLFLECGRNPEAQRRTRAAMTRGLQTREAEMALGVMVGDL